jgi:cobalt-zinc-cadmium efflux system outer membrane protein
MVQRMMLVPVALILGTAGTLVLAGNEPPADANTPQTLSEYLRYGALNNAGLKAAFEEWKAALEQIPQAKALPDPRFTYRYFIESVETRVGPQIQGVSLMQTFPWFGKIAARTDAAAAAAKAAQERYEARKLQLFYDVKNAFYEYAYLASAIRIGRENLDLMRHFEEVARTKHIIAAAGHPDVIRAQVEVLRLQNDLIALEEVRLPTVARLNAVLNRTPEAPLPWPQVEAGDPMKIDRQALIAALKEHNPRLAAMNFDVERRRQEVEVAKRNFYPDVGLGLDWIDTGEARMPGVPDSGKDAVIFTLSMNLPLWQRSYRAGEQQARALARRAVHDRTEMENDLLARTERAVYEVENNQRWVTLYGDVLVPKAQELIGTSEAAYMAGTIDFLRLIDAEQTLLQFRLQRERFWANQQQRLAELEMLVGTDVSQAVAAQK